MLTSVLHWLASIPWVYDRIQSLAGADEILRKLATWIPPDSVFVLDVGGGTGNLQSVCPTAATYVCLDLDPVKLGAFRAKSGRGYAVLASATALPVRDSCADVVVCMSLLHHLDDTLLENSLGEVARVLRPTGIVVCAEPVYEASHLVGRVIWRYDRGSHPRSSAALRECFAAHFDVAHFEDYTLVHRRLFCVGRRHIKPAPIPL